MKKFILFALAIVIMLTPVLCSCSPEAEVPTTRVITDSIGREIEVPYEVNKVATLVGPSYDKVFMLGEKDKIAMVGFAQSAWANLIEPRPANIPTATNAKSPNIEELLNLDIDAVFTWADTEPLRLWTNAGIPALSALASSSSPPVRRYISKNEAEVNLYAEVLGEKRKKASETILRIPR
jgi:iron complex transport system substrate-binding protein